MNPIDFLAQYYDPQSRAFNILVEHGKQVANKALAAARRVPELKPDLEFIETAAMLHDIGIFQTDSPVLGCYGKHPYICHGILGSELLKTKVARSWRWSVNGTWGRASVSRTSGSTICRCPGAI